MRKINIILASALFFSTAVTAQGIKVTVQSNGSRVESVEPSIPDGFRWVHYSENVWRIGSAATQAASMKFGTISITASHKDGVITIEQTHEDGTKYLAQLTFPNGIAKPGVIRGTIEARGSSIESYFKKVVHNPDVWTIRPEN